MSCVTEDGLHFLLFLALRPKCWDILPVQEAGVLGPWDIGMWSSARLHAVLECARLPGLY